MKGTTTWSYAPYKPLLSSVGDIYICRIAPYENSVHLEWPQRVGECDIYYKKREDEDFILAGKTDKNEFDVKGLEDETDYEFYVSSGNKKSRVRLARTCAPVGVVVNYLHPEDDAYAISGKYLASPSIVRHPDGHLLASMDVYGQQTPQNLTLIYRSDDNGATWRYQSELMPCFWGKLFIHRGELYMLACSTEYGDLIIGKSTDGGKSFSAPVCLMRGANGKNGSLGCHKAPQNVLSHNGRLYLTVEWGNWQNNEGYKHAAMMLSIDENDDLLSPECWTFTDPVKFDTFAPELDELPPTSMTIEGTPVIAPDGRILNIMRFQKHGYVLAYELKDAETLTYSHLIEMPTNHSKFTIRYDEISKKYYSIVSEKYGDCKPSARNLLSLVTSSDLEHWEVAKRLIDYSHLDPKCVGFQYVDFDFDGEDIIYLSRTAWNNAHNFHDSNYTTFHRIEKFREI
jgi:hypothetical protein